MVITVLVLLSAVDPGDPTVSGWLEGGVGAGPGLPIDILPDDILIGKLPGSIPGILLDDVDVRSAGGADDAGGGDGGRGGVRMRSNLLTNTLRY